MKQRSIKENIKIKGGLRKIKSDYKSDVFLVLDNIRSMYNVGAIFRSAEGARVRRVYLCGITPTPPREKIFKTSLGAVDFVDWEYRKNTVEAIEELKQSGVQIVALEQTNQSVNYKKANYKKPVAIVVGHELKGISSQVLELCDLSVEIPMFGRANSLNVSTSTTVVLYEVLDRLTN
ncbi:MAG: tRNA (guanosine(18)-2'-O)-methyltransferase [candidate division WS2 bacterium ADurb.Bin280]|uniref:tRNA (Guanosine(18)-2'-O)-methyltransferase n=1 Tax=candidate division WS2 bacterium ADurb.Bin280 TaxID=1852829 RepID=A0A1V5SE25_9BACT|nr:MAG: tRNA (guanosine(18)-2'-O)-methyltransferase [candidate division WS2 bacterium ADurb.Bin280]